MIQFSDATNKTYDSREFNISKSATRGQTDGYLNE